MNRPYTAQSPYSLTPTERLDTISEDRLDEYEYDGLQEYPDDPEYQDYSEYDEARIDKRWMWVAGIAGVILFFAVGTTGVILGGGDSGSVSATATSDAPTTSAAPVTTSAAPPAASSSPRVQPSLPAETVTTVSPTAETTVSTPAAAAPPPAPAPSPRTVTYQVTGTKPTIDFVTVIYTDQQGALQTDVNVALPWSKTVVLDPGVELSAVTATSVGGQLNCTITDASSGTLLAYQNNNTMIANCTK
jgi:hypothetical protein